MSRSKHGKQAWRTMREWASASTKISKLCKKCIKTCKHESLGELTYCQAYKEKE